MAKRRNTINGEGNLLHAEISPNTAKNMNFIMDIIEESGGKITKNKLAKKLLEKQVQEDSYE
ncbi:TPA: hypothetical protein ACPVYE_004649 [Vibrio parahaemolyticus]